MTGLSDIRSTIAARQNLPEAQRLLKARQWGWIVAGRWQLAQLVTVLAAPILVITIGLIVPGSKPWISFFAVCTTLLDIAWIDRQYRKSLKLGARASELLDVHLFELDWNGLAAGKQPTPEETDRSVRRWNELKDPNPIKDWYSSEVDRAPLGLARAICQRTNLSYDSDLRSLYVTIINAGAVAIAVLVLVIGMFSTGTFADFVLAGWVPSAPFLFWALRERFRQIDAIEANAPITAEAEKLIAQVIDGGCDEEECRFQSRLMQNAIFSRRATTVLLLPGIYKNRRPDAERDMHAGAAYWVNKAGL